MSTLAVEVRDSVGIFQGACTLVIAGCSDPEAMEAIACREELALASHLDLHTFRLVSACISMMKVIQGAMIGSYWHYYRMDLLSRAVTAFSPGYRAGTTIPGLKVKPSVPGHRAGTKEGPLVPVGNTNRD